MIPGYGVSSGFEIYVQDQKGGKIEDLLSITRQMIDKLNARPEIARATTSFDNKFPQFLVEWTLLVANATVFLHPMYFQYCLAISVVTTLPT